ncbi:hypothetical protein [Streptomyces pseudogriseolus]
MSVWNFLGVRGAYGQQIMPPPRLPNCEVVDGVPGSRCAITSTPAPA